MRHLLTLIAVLAGTPAPSRRAMLAGSAAPIAAVSAASRSASDMRDIAPPASAYLPQIGGDTPVTLKMHDGSERTVTIIGPGCTPDAILVVSGGGTERIPRADIRSCVVTFPRARLAA